MDTLRANIEAQVESLWGVRTTVEYADRPFDAPTSGGWLSVEVAGNYGVARAIGTSGNGLNVVSGTVALAISENEATGMGNVTRLAEYARAMAMAFVVSGVRFRSPSGPESPTFTGRLARVTVRVPFDCDEVT